MGTKFTAHPSLAALVNGTLGHALDFDDVWADDDGVVAWRGHPSVCVLPAVLAAAGHLARGCMIRGRPEYVTRITWGQTPSDARSLVPPGGNASGGEDEPRTLQGARCHRAFMSGGGG